MIILNKEKKKPFEGMDLDNYKKVGNLAVDMCAECIIFERRRGREPKTILLHNAYYRMFREWVLRTFDEETAEKTYEINGVEIQEDNFTNGIALRIEYVKPIAES